MEIREILLILMELYSSEKGSFSVSILFGYYNTQNYVSNVKGSYRFVIPDLENICLELLFAVLQPFVTKLYCNLDICVVAILDLLSQPPLLYLSVLF